MRFSMQMQDLLCQLETVALVAYDDGVGNWTIGVGRVKGVKKGMRITIAQARDMLREDLTYFDRKIAELFPNAKEQAHIDALGLWMFNVGAHAAKQSTLRKLYNQGATNAAMRQLPRWCKARGKELDGLKKRRLVEQFVWMGQIKVITPDFIAACREIIA